MINRFTAALNPKLLGAAPECVSWQGVQESRHLVIHANQDTPTGQDERRQTPGAR
jgi:hypothetical protein